MWLIEMLAKLKDQERYYIDRVDEHTGEVKHDLTNLRARIDIISRLVQQMQADGSRQR